MSNIDELNTTKPGGFWKYINKLGPRTRNNIPEKVFINGTEVNDINIGLKVWKEEFHKLYNKLEEPETNMEGSLYDNMLYEKQVLENMMNDNGYIENVYINNAIEFAEVDKIIGRAKRNKAMGIEKIPYEVLKNYDVKLVVYKLLETLFEHSLAPSRWLKANIIPVPKGADKDPCIPLN